MILRSILSLLVVGLMSTTAMANDLEDVKCLLNPKANAKKETAVKYLDGEVYFCCNGCAGKFEADKEKYATVANQQLVQSGQYKQTGCPFSGGAVKDGTVTKVGDMEVGFCCGGCKGKVEGAADDDARAELVFASKAFEKGFGPAKDEDDEEEDDDSEHTLCCVMGEEVNKDLFAEHNGGKVHFCCKDCITEFKDNTEDYAVKANMYLVATEQFKQASCPFSGGKVKDGTEVKVGDMEIGFCCPNCQGKVEKASEEDRMKLVFADKAFKKGFEKKEKDD